MYVISTRITCKRAGCMHSMVHINTGRIWPFVCWCRIPCCVWFDTANTMWTNTRQSKYRFKTTLRWRLENYSSSVKSVLGDKARHFYFNHEKADGSLVDVTNTNKLQIVGAMGVGRKICRKGANQLKQYFSIQSEGKKLILYTVKIWTICQSIEGGYPSFHLRQRPWCVLRN